MDAQHQHHRRRRRNVEGEIETDADQHLVDAHSLSTMLLDRYARPHASGRRVTRVQRVHRRASALHEAFQCEWRSGKSTM